MGVFFHMPLRQGTQDVLVYVRDGNDLIYILLISLSVIVGFDPFLYVLMDSRGRNVPACSGKSARETGQEGGSGDKVRCVEAKLWSLTGHCHLVQLIRETTRGL